MRRILFVLIALAGTSAGQLRADDPPTSSPRLIPLTRPEMKQYLEDMKQRKPRIPLPELTDDEKAKLGERGQSYESRLRYHYMPAGTGGFGGGGFGGDKDPNMTLDNTFKVQLFWIVSRANNCQYCQGHQEDKLLRAGQKEDQIAALDSDWSLFSEKERVAFAFARKITFEPHKFNDADIEGLKAHYTDLQILEMLLYVAGNNAINRWKEGLGVPQSAGGIGGSKGANPVAEKQTYLTPTSDKFQGVVTKVAPVQLDVKGKPTHATVCLRPGLEPRADVEKALAVASTRTPRIVLADDEKARAMLPEGTAKGPLPQWVRLLANFTSSKGRIASQLSADEKGDLKPLLKAQVSWIIARQDRAWYAAAEAKRRLKALGQTDEQIYALDSEWKDFSETDRALFTVARKLAASPVVLTDDDVAAAVKLAGPKLVVQLVSYTTTRASFDRITEAAGLAVEK